MPRKPLIVFTTVHPWIKRVVAELQPPDIDVAFCDLADDAASTALLPDADFLVCVALPTDRARLLRRCRLVMYNGVGYDPVDRATLHAMGIPLAITPAMTPEGVAEHTLMLILALYKQLGPVRDSLARGEWEMFGWRQGSHNLVDKTLGIVGLGRIGKRVAHLAHAFGCRIIYNDIVDMPAELEARYALERVSFDALLARSDIVTAHVPLTPLTRNMFSADALARLQRHAIFINTSRGGTYDLDALTVVLEAGRLAGAGLDVYDQEPLPADHPIRRQPRAICTPHIASGTVERQYAINRAQFANCRRVLDGLPPAHEIPFDGA